MADFVNLFEWIQTVKPEDLPRAPFGFHKERYVVNVEKFLNSIKLEAYPGSPRAKYGTLQKDLRRLFEICNSGPTS